jgi:hypothetical protein
MAQKWYKKASVQVALVAGVFVVLATLIHPAIVFVWDSMAKPTIQDARVHPRGNGKYEVEVLMKNPCKQEVLVHSVEFEFIGMSGTFSGIFYDQPKQSPLDITEVPLGDTVSQLLAIRLAPRSVDRFYVSLVHGWTDEGKTKHFRTRVLTSEGTVSGPKIEVWLTPWTEEEDAVRRAVNQGKPNVLESVLDVHGETDFHKVIRGENLAAIAAEAEEPRLLAALLRSAPKLESSVLQEALHHAVEKGSTPNVKLLTHDHRVDPGYAQDVKPSTWRFNMTDERYEFNVRFKLTEKGTPGVSVLHKAAFLGLQDIVTILLEAGADPTLPDSEGKTPLDWFHRDPQGSIKEALRAAANGGK